LRIAHHGSFTAPGISNEQQPEINVREPKKRNNLLSEDARLLDPLDRTQRFAMARGATS